MTALSLERYISGTSPLHALDARVKLFVTVAFILVSTLIPAGTWWAYAALLALLLPVLFMTGVPLPLFRRTFLALPFVLVAFPIIFSRPGAAVGSFELGPWTLVASDAGLSFFISLLIKSWLSILAAVILSGTTPFSGLLHALHWFRLPTVLVGIIGFMYRYLFVIGDEAQRLLRGRAARSAEGGGTHGGSLAWRARVAGSMVGSLFLRSYERSERIYSAMLARGYDGRLMLLDEPKLRTADMLNGTVACLALVSVLAAAVIAQ